MGYKEIEVGFPSASQTDFDFVRQLIEERPDPRRRRHPGADPGPRAPDRADLRVDRAAPSRRSCTCTTPPPPCSAGSCSGWTATASTTSPSRARSCAGSYAENLGGTEVFFEYSPESYTGTELEFAVEVCDAVIDVWQPTPGPQGDRQPAGHRRDGHAERLRRLDRVDAPQPGAPRLPRAVAAPAQRPRHRGGRRRAGLPGGRRPDRGLPVRQRRAHRQRLPGHAGHEPVQPGHRPADRLPRHRRDPPHRGVLQPAAGARAAPVRRRPGLHGVLRLAPGRHQEGPRRDGPRRRGCRCGRRRLPLGGPVPADRPEGRRPHATRP